MLDSVTGPLAIQMATTPPTLTRVKNTLKMINSRANIRFVFIAAP
jgi:hypothetical protein